MFPSVSMVAFIVSVSQAVAVAFVGLFALGIDTLAPIVSRLGSPSPVVGLGLILIGTVCLAALATVTEVLTDG